MKGIQQLESPEQGKWTFISWIKGILGICMVIFLCIFIASTNGMVQKYRTTMQLSQQHALATTQTIADSINDQLAALASAANELAENLREISWSQETIDTALNEAALNHFGFNALGVAFDLYQADPQLRLFAPFIRQQGTAYQLDRIDQYYDYTGHAAYSAKNGNSKNSDWYLQGTSGRSGWLAPYFDMAYQQHTLKYVVPLQKNTEARKVAGVVFLDIDLDWVRQQVENHDVGDNGYAIVVNEFDQIIYHGLKGSKKIVSDLNQAITPTYFAEFTAGKLGTNELTGRSAWFNRYPIGETGWYVLTVMNAEIGKAHLFENDSDEDTRVIHESDLISWIVNAVVLCLLIYIWIAFIKQQQSVAQLLRHAFITSLLLTVGIVSIWITEYYTPSVTRNQSLTLSNRAIVEQFQNDYAVAALQESKTPPFFVPTGLFIQSIEFQNATNVAITGYIWQRFPKHFEEDIEHGVIFPEAIETSITEAYEHEEGDEIVKGWYFEATLRETFDYKIYPFDRQLLWVRLWHTSFSKNVILVPDFKSFDSLNPNTLPGVEQDFVLSEWNPSRAFFGIKVNKYNSNFGDRQFTSHDKMPELYFNLEISRNILNPFIAHLFPLAVVLLMLYGLVLTISKQEAKLTFTGFNVSTIVAACSALFFILLIMHVQLRDELAVNTIVYLEYFYLVSYITILMVTVNAVLISYDPPLGILAFKDNFIPKLIYWPILLTWIFTITAILF